MVLLALVKELVVDVGTPDQGSCDDMRVGSVPPECDLLAAAAQRSEFTAHASEKSACSFVRCHLWRNTYASEAGAYSGLWCHLCKRCMCAWGMCAGAEWARGGH
jgi:hypothetical protein